MKQAIEFNHYRADTMIIGARKKQHYASYLHVHKGTVLIRLGKAELPVCANQGFWLPIDCLNAVTIMKGSQVSTLNFSVRSTALLSNQAGFIEKSPLITGIIEQLHARQEKSNEDWDAPYGRLLRCARDYLATLTPHDITTDSFRLSMTSLDALGNGKALSEITGKALEHALGLSTEDIAVQLRVREWVRLYKSGRSIKKIALAVSLSETEVEQLLRQIAGIS
ncbi:hypothetical protein A1OK_20870 [Enterovibrio norvegicus FF-454]|uniref:AraC family transcriptional regulator n=1 Tax=Enterovibrio norvegicus FF-454 TaxID=1185651 RepID=A0A1E5CC25_9GAMM|nr:hypothetical protein [Enterovibrio norvegicus]OEE63039.1 hypothetical protein A1OK_20870 [Enterovibrio norvegicus FF-454]